jgi:hypothetical protein
MTDTRSNLKRTIQLLTTVLLNLDETLHELNLNQNGFPTNTGGEGSTPTLNESGTPAGLERYLNQPDPAAQDLHQFTTTTTQLHTAALNLHRITTQWATPTKLNQAQRGTECLACARYVPNTATDRLRAGLCLSCHRSWARSTKERGEWLLQRRKQTTTPGGGDTNHTHDPIQHTATPAIATN